MRTHRNVNSSAALEVDGKVAYRRDGDDGDSLAEQVERGAESRSRVVVAKGVFGTRQLR
jgi:hypothetical protein